jgi:GDP-L-fucose synthase
MNLPEEKFKALTTATTIAPIINVGSGKDLTIHDLAILIAKTVGFTGDIQFDSTQPDGTPRKQLDVSKIASLGWQAQRSLSEGLTLAYDFFKQVNEPAFSS